MNTNVMLLFLVIFNFALPGCSLLIGNVKPAHEKSISYSVEDMTKHDPDWVRKMPTQSDSNSTDTEAADLTFQSQQTGSIISLNSSCLKGDDGNHPSLHTLTRELLLGLSLPLPSQEKNITLQGIPALDSTVEGNMDNTNVKIRTVVLQGGKCTYDLIFIARPAVFESQMKEFSLFVNSFKLH